MPIHEERVSNRLQSAYVIVIGLLTAIALPPYQLIVRYKSGTTPITVTNFVARMSQNLSPNS